MKILQIIFAALLVCFFGIGLVYSQKNPEKAKSKNKKPLLQSVEVKASLMVLEPNGTFADIKLEDVKIYEDGAEQKIARFEKKANAANIAVMVDNTGSMQSQIKRVEAAGLTFVDNIRPQDEVFIMRFVDSEKIEMLQDWTAAKPLLNDALKDMFIEAGQSAVIDAVYLATGKIAEREKVDKSKRNAIILISDGEDRDSFYSRADLFDLLKTSDVQVFVIGLTEQLDEKRTLEIQNKKPKAAAENFIKLLALQTGGAAYIVDGKDKAVEAALVQSLKSILTELNSQYVVGYTSTNQKRDGLPRKLTVQIADGANGEKRQAFVRDGFIVPKAE